ncbi:DNA-binding domain-containing protein [Burkholderia cenocepacia]|uniref:HvfC/BufC N-terminal domain-containing protein n=1 Tax=Burkholderia cenocepacia TaxID=95486 RepID=UPI0031FD5028
MASSAERLEEFAAALLDPGRAMPQGLVGPDGEPSARRFSVYRNNVFVGLTDALRAGFPCVVRLVGDEFFAAMARIFAAARPPSSPVLLHYGAEFPDFIASFPPAESIPYLADVARIERATTEAHHEREAVPLTPSAFADVPPDQAALLRFRLHPSVRLVRSPLPAFTIWRMNVADGTPAPVDLSETQDTMVLRPDAEVDVRQVLAASYDFVAALSQGLTLSEAMETAIAIDGDFDLSENLRELIQMGAFVGFELEAGENNHE